MALENWYLDILRNGVDPDHEANTSRHVHRVLEHCFGWPFDAIVPQASKRGYIDYKLEYTRPAVAVHVEVKRFGHSLSDAMIRKYIVRPGPSSADFQVGALTNLHEWHILVAGAAVKQVSGDRIAGVRRISITSRRDIEDVESLIGYRQRGELRELRAAVVEAPEVITYLLLNDDGVAKALRGVLADKRDRFGIDAHVPRYDALRAYIAELLDRDWSGECPFTEPKFRAAVCSSDVAEAIDNRAYSLFGGRGRVRRIGELVRSLLDTVDD